MSASMQLEVEPIKAIGAQDLPTPSPKPEDPISPDTLKPQTYPEALKPRGSGCRATESS